MWYCLHSLTIRKFNKTIEILQGDIEALENEKINLEKKLDQSKKTGLLADITVGRRGRSSPFGSPFASRKGGVSPSVSSEAGGAVSASGGDGGPSEQALQSPLLLARVGQLGLDFLPVIYCFNNFFLLFRLSP